MLARMFTILFVAASCAQGGIPNMASGDDTQHADASPQRDAPAHAIDAPVSVIDARPPIDASIPVDAAPPDGALFCSDNTQCTDPGTCCFVSFCVPGAGLGSNLCFPS